MAQPDMREVATARMLLCAAFVDMALSLALSQSGLLLLELVDRSLINDPTLRIATLLGLFVCIHALHLFCIEVVCSGASLGRLAIGAQVSDANGAPLPLGLRLNRFVRKITFFGLSGLSAQGLAYYHRMGGIEWTHALDNARPIATKRVEDWQLRVKGGAHAGLKVRLGDLKGFQQNAMVVIGRSSKSDLALPRSDRVSSRHCVLRSRNGELYLADTGSKGEGSTNKTWVRGKSIKPRDWVPMGNITEFNAADVPIEILR